MNATLTALQQLLQKPDGWRCDGFTLEHMPTGLALWIANGRAFLKTVEYGKVHITFSFYSRWKLWPDVRRCIDAVALAQLKNQ